MQVLIKFYKIENMIRNRHIYPHTQCMAIHTMSWVAAHIDRLCLK